MAKLRPTGKQQEQSPSKISEQSQGTRVQVMERAWQLRAGWGGGGGSDDGSWHSAE
jgi:hypothetical protein